MSNNGSGRQFPYHVTRIGSTASKYFTPIQCCKCGTEKVFESFKALPDEVISKRFKQWGWLLGRNRSHDYCPRCLGVTPENKLAQKFRVTKQAVAVLTPSEVVDQVATKKSDIEKRVRIGMSEGRTLLALVKDIRTIKDSLSIMINLLTKLTEAQAKKPKTPAKKAPAARKKKEPKADGLGHSS